MGGGGGWGQRGKRGSPAKVVKDASGAPPMLSDARPNCTRPEQVEGGEKVVAGALRVDRQGTITRLRGAPQLEAVAMGFLSC